MKERRVGQVHLRGGFLVVFLLVERDRLGFFPLFISFVYCISLLFLVGYGEKEIGEPH